MTPSERAKELGVPFPQIKTLSDTTGKANQDFTYMFKHHPALFDVVCLGVVRVFMEEAKLAVCMHKTDMQAICVEGLKTSLMLTEGCSIEAKVKDGVFSMTYFPIDSKKDGS